MRNLLALIGLAVVVFFGAGWYFGWYAFNVERGSDGKLKILGDVDTNKIAEDAKKLSERVGQIANETPATKPQTDDKKPLEGLVGPPTPPQSEVKVGPFKFMLDPSAVGRE